MLLIGSFWLSDIYTSTIMHHCNLYVELSSCTHVYPLCSVLRTSFMSSSTCNSIEFTGYEHNNGNATNDEMNVVIPKPFKEKYYVLWVFFFQSDLGNLDPNPV